MKITMDILANGKTTKSKERVVTFTPMVKNTTGNGQETKSLEMEHTNIKMEIFTSEDGRMTEDQDKEK